MKKILIIEDDLEEVNALIETVKRVDDTVKVMTTDKLGEALEYAVSNNISLFLVDIVLMPKKKTDTSGIDFVEAIRNMPKYKYIPVIFVSSLDDPRLHAYQDLHCYRYIQKPVLYKEVEDTVREALEFSRFVDDEKPLRLKQNNILYSIPKSDIIYADSHAAKMVIVTEKEKFGFYYLTCRDLLKQLDSEDFIQCSRSAIVNRKRIIEVNRTKETVRLRCSDDLVRVGKSFKKEFFRKIEEND